MGTVSHAGTKIGRVRKMRGEPSTRDTRFLAHLVESYTKKTERDEVFEAQKGLELTLFDEVFKVHFYISAVLFVE